MVFGKTADGRTVNKYTLKAGNLSAEILDYGATIKSINVTAPSGAVTNILLGYETIAEYEQLGGYLGAVIGRNAGRIAQSEFSLGGKKYKVGSNNGVNSLHGGKKGFDKAVFELKDVKPDYIVLEHNSPDGDEGYPAALKLQVKYTLTARGLTIEYFASSDGETCANFTNHAYFNLDGEGAKTKSIYDTYIKINAPYYMYAGKDLVPTGRKISVEGTPYDLREGTTFGEVIESDYQDLVNAGGFDNYFLFGEKRDVDQKVVTAYSGRSKIRVNVYSDTPGIQLYSGNFMGKEGPYAYRGAFCLETQNPPNSPNIADYAAVVTVKPGKDYYSKTLYEITVE